MRQLDLSRATAALLGRLLVREIDRELAESLSRGELGEALAALGLELPVKAGDREDGDATDRDEDARSAGPLDALAAEYFELLLHPTRHAPLVQSLVVESRHEGDAARAVRAIAASTGLELDRELARGAPPDHLGVQLLLWSELARRFGPVPEFVTHHLRWALPALEARARESGSFYGRLAAVVARFIESISSPDPDALLSPG